MTTIIALQRHDEVDLAWDGQMTAGNAKHDLLTPKVWCQDGIIFGIAGVLRAADIISTTDFPEYDGTDARKWLIRHLVPVLKDALKEERAVNNEEGGIELDVLVVVDGTAFEFDGLLSPVSNADGIYTLGSGSQFARGALMAGADLQTALEIAHEVDPYTGGNLTVTTASQMILDEPEPPKISSPRFGRRENEDELPTIPDNYETYRTIMNQLEAEEMDKWAEPSKPPTGPAGTSDVYDGPPLTVINNYYYPVDHDFTD